MKQFWKKYATKFDAISPRERLFIAVAILAVLALAGETAFIEPQLVKQKSAERQIEQQTVELTSAQQQIAVLEPRLKNPDAANHAALDRARGERSVIDTQLRGLEQTLVAPRQMAALLEDMLKHNQGLRLVSLRTLPVGPLIEPRDAKLDNVDKAGATKEPGMTAAAPAGMQVTAQLATNLVAETGIFKHGVEISVQGSYGELLSYLAQVEKLPQRMFWSNVRLKVDEYPRATLTLTVYTLSLDKTWLVV